MSKEFMKYELPEGWTWVPIREVSIPSEKVHQKDDIPLIISILKQLITRNL